MSYDQNVISARKAATDLVMASAQERFKIWVKANAAYREHFGINRKIPDSSPRTRDEYGIGSPVRGVMTVRGLR